MHYYMTVWPRGNALVLIKEAFLHQALLILSWVTVCGQNI